MIYIKQPEQYLGILDVCEDAQIIEMANEIELECAISTFDMYHTTIISKTALLESDDPSSDDSGEDQEDSAGAGVPASNTGNKSMLEKAKAFIKNIWDKIKNAITRLIYWFTTKIKSNTDFIKDIEAKGNDVLNKSVKAKYNYKESFKTLLDSYDSYMEGANRLKDIFEKSRKEEDHSLLDMFLGAFLDNLPVSKDDFNNSFRNEMNELFKESETNMTVKEMVDTLKTHSVKIDGLKKFSAGIMNFFKAINISIKRMSISLSPIYKLMSAMSSCITIIITNTYKMTLAIRNDIKHGVSSN